jgi:hypothetical protein
MYIKYENTHNKQNLDENIYNDLSNRSNVHSPSSTVHANIVTGCAYTVGIDVSPREEPTGV